MEIAVWWRRAALGGTTHWRAVLRSEMPVGTSTLDRPQRESILAGEQPVGELRGEEREGIVASIGALFGGKHQPPKPLEVGLELA